MWLQRIVYVVFDTMSMTFAMFSKNLEYFSNDKEYVEELMRAEAEEIMRNQEKYFAGFHEGEAKGKLDGRIEGKLEGKLETQTYNIPISMDI